MSKSKQTLFAQKIPDKLFEFERQDDYDEFERNAPPGRYVFKIAKERPPKSQKQLGYIFPGMIDKIIYEGNEVRQDGVDSLMKYLLDADIPKGQELTVDFVKALCYAIAPTIDDKGRVVTLSSMDTLQATLFIKRVQKIMAGYVYLADPDPNWKDKKRR